MIVYGVAATEGASVTPAAGAVVDNGNAGWTDTEKLRCVPAESLTVMVAVPTSTGVTVSTEPEGGTVATARLLDWKR